MNADPSPTSFLDPQKLLDSSRVAGVRVSGWPMLVLAVFGLVVLSTRSDEPVIRGIPAPFPKVLGNLQRMGCSFMPYRLGRKPDVVSNE